MIETKILNISNREEVKDIDKVSGFCVENWLEDTCCAWGLFLDNKLIGYCTIGYADGTYKELEEYAGYNSETSKLLSDVFITEEHRGNGFANKMVNEILKTNKYVKGSLVFITLLEDNLSHMYKKIGFENINEYSMVKHC